MRFEDYGEEKYKFPKSYLCSEKPKISIHIFLSQEVQNVVMEIK